MIARSPAAERVCDSSTWACPCGVEEGGIYQRYQMLRFQGCRLCNVSRTTTHQTAKFAGSTFSSARKVSDSWSLIPAGSAHNCCALTTVPSGQTSHSLLPTRVSATRPDALIHEPLRSPHIKALTNRKIRVRLSVHLGFSGKSAPEFFFSVIILELREALGHGQRFEGGVGDVLVVGVGQLVDEVR